MKLHKWTVGLAAAGIVTIPSLMQAQEVNMVRTVAEGTTLTGYVDVAAQWNLGTGNINKPGYAYSTTGGGSKGDGFNLNVVDLVLDKPLDETPWAAGYHVELGFGPDAGTLATDSTFGNAGDFSVRQAYVALRTPIGNGIDWKIGVFDTIVGYESTSGPNNPNYTRSYGYTIEPTTHEGILGTYRICDFASVTVGVANTFGPAVGSRAVFADPSRSEYSKTVMAAVTLTAPKDWGWVADSSLTAGLINGFSAATAGGNGNLTHGYVGATLATPVAGLKVGAALDYRHPHESPAADDTWVYGVYASYQATEKLSIHGRAEYVDDKAGLIVPAGSGINVLAFTCTVQYDLWKNVLSRAEIRWDNSQQGKLYGGIAGAPTLNNAVMLAANVVYKF